MEFVPRHIGGLEQGQARRLKAPFKLQEIWAIRIPVQMRGRLRDLALFDLGIEVDDAPEIAEQTEV